MPRTAAVEKSAPLNLKLEEGLLAKLTLFLYSEAEGRVPVGAYKRFFEERILEFFQRIERKVE